MSAIIFALSFHFVRSSLMKKNMAWRSLQAAEEAAFWWTVVTMGWHFIFPYHPCMVYFTYIWFHTNPPNVGEYTSPTDPMGFDFFRGYGGLLPEKLTYRLNAGTRRLCSFFESWVAVNFSGEMSSMLSITWDRRIAVIGCTTPGGIYGKPHGCRKYWPRGGV